MRAKKRQNTERREIWVGDTETDPFRKGRYVSPFVADVYNGDEHFTFWGDDCVDQLVLFMHDKKAVIYFHNGGKFDYQFFLHWLRPWDKLSIINGRLAAFKIGECEYRDSFNLIPYSLASYQKEKFDYDKMEVENREQFHDEIEKYLLSDTENLFDLVSGFIEEYGSYITQAGAAMSIWQSMAGVKADKTDAAYYENFSKYYYGGRVEALKKGCYYGDFMAVDIRSAYPFAMLSNHASGDVYFSGKARVRELENNADNWRQAFFTIDAVSRGALPFRDLDSGALSFPNDGVRRVYSVTGWELYAGLETETVDIFNILCVTSHDKQINFDGYINHFFQKRLICKAEGDKRGDLFCKIFMNSLYGKFGADPENYFDYVVGDPLALPRFEEYGYKFGGTVGPNLLMQRPIDEGARRYYNVATAASITGFVRAYLWRSLHTATNPIYCDTDCIIAERVNVSTGEKLGDWELEGHFDFAAIGGKKLYALRYGEKHDKAAQRGEYKTRSKGVRLDAEQIIEVASGGIVSYTSDVPTYSAKRLPTFTTRRVRMT